MSVDQDGGRAGFLEQVTIHNGMSAGRHELYIFDANSPQVSGSPFSGLCDLSLVGIISGDGFDLDEFR